VIPGASIGRTISWCTGSSRSAAKKHVSPAAMPIKPLRINQPSEGEGTAVHPTKIKLIASSSTLKRLLTKVIAEGEKFSPIPLKRIVPTAQEAAEAKAAATPTKCSLAFAVSRIWLKITFAS
jgi:hypothetical protein